MKTLLLILLVAVSTHTILLAQQPALKTRIVASDLRVPWELVWGPDNKIWMTEQVGRISTIDPTTGEQTILLAVIPDLINVIESGLLGMVLHPLFAENPYVYIGYTYAVSQSIRLKVVRYRYDGAVLIEPTVLLGNIKGGTIHNGCRLAFGPDAMLYVTAGEGGNPEDAQKLDFNNGKVLRINPNGGIPADNPLPGSPIWSWGHRNAQGLAFGPNGILYSSEHGANTNDEVNIIMKGRNYGWPRVEGLCDMPNELVFCADSNVVEPIGTPWTPTLAVAAIVYYQNDLIPEWKDHLLMCAMKAQTLVVMTLSEDRTKFIKDERFFRNTFGRLRSICVSPDGRIFIGSTNQDFYGSPAQFPGSDWIIEITPQTSDVKDEGAIRDGSYNSRTQHAIFKLSGTLLTAFALSSDATLIISDIVGRTISEHHDGGGGFHVDVESLVAGVYTAIVHTSQGAQPFTFIR